MKKYIAGLQMYSVRDQLKEDFEGTVKAVAEMGYKDVEFAGYYGGLTGEQMKALLDKYGLVSISVHENIEVFLEKGKEAVDFFKAFGVKYVTVPHYSAEHYETEEARKETLEKFTKVATLLREHGMILQYHNHDFEFGKLDDGRYYLDWLYESMPENLLKPQLDVCWVKYAGEDPVKYINKYKDRMFTIHFKDFVCKEFASGPVYELIGVKPKKKTKAENGFAYRPLGKGMQDFDPMLAALENTGVEYIIVEQDNCYDTPPLEAVKISREFLKTKGI